MAVGTGKTVVIRYGTTTGGKGTVLSLRGGISTPTDVTASFTSTSFGGSYRTSLSSDPGTNTWQGPIQLNGADIVGFYAAGSTAPLIINGTTYGTNGFTGTAFYRGSGPVTINGQVNMPTGRFSVTDNSVVTVNSIGNIWTTTQSAYGRLVVGANNALCPTASVIIGQPGSAAFLDLGGWTQEITGLATAGTASSQTIGSSSLTANSTLVFNGGTNVSSYAGQIVDSVAGGTKKVALDSHVRSAPTRRRQHLQRRYDHLWRHAGTGFSRHAGQHPAHHFRSGCHARYLCQGRRGPEPRHRPNPHRHGTVDGSLTIGSGATLDPGASIAPRLTVTNSLTTAGRRDECVRLEQVRESVERRGQRWQRGLWRHTGAEQPRTGPGDWRQLQAVQRDDLLRRVCGDHPRQAGNWPCLGHEQADG